MSSIRWSIRRLIEICRKRRVRRNRVRMSPSAYEKLCVEMQDAHLKSGRIAWETDKTVYGLIVEVSDDVKADNIYMYHTDDPDFVVSQVTAQWHSLLDEAHRVRP